TSLGCGLMPTLAEGLNILSEANIGADNRPKDAETAPLTNPEYYQYDFDLGAIAEVWRRGRVVSRSVPDLTAASFAAAPHLDGFQGVVSDSGEGRWTAHAA